MIYCNRTVTYFGPSLIFGINDRHDFENNSRIKKELPEKIIVRFWSIIDLSCTIVYICVT